MEINPANILNLENELKNRLQGEVYFDAVHKALYASDASNYRQEPLAVIVPKNKQDIITAVEICRRSEVPVLPRGAGTSLAGQACNFAVVLDLTKYCANILEIDTVNKTARVEPGVVLDQLNRAAAKFDLIFGPDPATHSHCTLGGMIGNNSCGVHSMKTGKTADNVLSLEILTYEGEIFTVGCHTAQEMQRIAAEESPRSKIYTQLQTLAERYKTQIEQNYPVLPRRVSGYNLDRLVDPDHFNVAAALTGTEGTCVFILEATLKLVKKAKFNSLLLLGYEDICLAADDVPHILTFKPAGLEGIDHQFISNMRQKAMHTEAIHSLPQGKGWLLVEFAADSEDALQNQISGFTKSYDGRSLQPALKICSNKDEVKDMWKIREAATGATVAVPGQKFNWSGWEDAAVAPQHLGAYLRDFYRLLKDFGYTSVIYGHFGDGCIHARIDFDFETKSGISLYRKFMEQAADLVVHYKGSFSGEHGDGHARAELLPKMFGPELIEAFRHFKSIWDPKNRMNPGKIVAPYLLDEHLRVTDTFRFNELSSPLAFEKDQGSFGKALLKCIGVGKCRKTGQGTMCPSYMATKDEMHSTRGRAHLLFEMLSNRNLIEKQNGTAVKESLDLCLSCKACKTECPTGIDMSTYKSVFLFDYFKKHARPLKAYLFGHIDFWARLGSRFPALSNSLAQAAWIKPFLAKLIGLAPERRLPHFAKKTYRRWHAENKPGSTHTKKNVILWPDTFTDHFYPEAAIAAHRLLAAYDYEVLLPPAGLCCGRPLYDYGMLDRAKQKLSAILNALETSIQADIPVIGLEPGCLSVFRDELTALFPDNPSAKKLASLCFSLNEFLVKNTGVQNMRALNQNAVIHGHCHQKALWGMRAEEQIFSSLQASFQILDNGCCGMAGSFGFKKNHYPVSMKCAELNLKGIQTDKTSWDYIISDGFSCREQIKHAAGVKVFHSAEYLWSCHEAKKASSGDDRNNNPGHSGHSST